MAARKYSLFEHTADLGLHIYGRDIEELFAAAAEALVAQFTDPRKIKPAGERRIKLEASTSEELLRTWMAELLYLYNAGGWLTRRVRFETLNEKSLAAVVLGETADPGRHEITREVKAVTWHRLRIEKLEPGGTLRATVILDV
ncbi:MAG TPA: archease [archaeon]|nr:archease [archaeon]